MYEEGPSRFCWKKILPPQLTLIRCLPKENIKEALLLKCTWRDLTSATLNPGTTTATVLTRSILSEGAKSVAAGMNPMDLRRGITVATQAVVEDLKTRATNISTTEEIAQVSRLHLREGRVMFD